MSNQASTILDRLYLHAEDMPDQLAYKFLNNGAPPDTLTYRQLEQRVRTLAAQFSELAAPGERALLLYPPGLEFIEAFLGCLAAGIIAVPAYPPRKNRKADRLLSIIHDCSPRLVLTTEQTAPFIDTELISFEGGRQCLSTDAIPTAARLSWQFPEIDSNAVAFLQYTSGSTGSPRGVMITHKNMVSNEEVIQDSFRHTKDSVMVSWLPVFHDMGLIGGALQPLYVGFPSILLSPVTFLQEPIKWLRAIMDHRGTTTGAPNFGWDHCAKVVTKEDKEGLDLSSLKIAYNGAEPVRAETLDRFTAAFSRCGFRLQSFFPCYGLAESTLFVSGGPPQRTPVRVRLCSPSLESHRWSSLHEHREDTRWLVSSGQVARGTHVEIINPKTCQRCGPNEVGEIWIASDSVASGYWNRPEDTKELLQATLADSGEGPYLRTGDLGYVDDGELFVTGRLKDLIIIRGRNLYPQDIEAAVERALPFVVPNACAAFATLIKGEERLAIVAEADRELVSTARAAEKEQATAGAHPNGDSATAMVEALVGKVRQAVIEEFEVPVHSVAFLRPGSFPRTSSGKVQRRSCRDVMQADRLEFVHHWTIREEAVMTNKDNVMLPINGHIPRSGEQEKYDDSVATEESPRYSLENDHLRRGVKRHALMIAIAPVIGMAVLLVALWGTWVTLLGLGLLAVMYFVTMTGITVGFHRHFTHNAFKTTTPIRVALAVAGSMAAEAPLVYWVATHRRHHQYSDKEGDPHSPHLHGESYWGRLKGLWYAHVGWMYQHDTTNTSAYAKDLLRDPTMRMVNRLYFWLVLLGLAIPTAVGGLITWTWLGACEGLFWGGFCRMFLAHHFTWSVNSICHAFGRHEFNTHDHSVNNAWLALPTLGESWHNNHHHAPTSAWFSRKWWQIDLGGWTVTALKFFGLAWDVKRDERPIQSDKPVSEKLRDFPQTPVNGQVKQPRSPLHNSRTFKTIIHEVVLEWLRSEVDKDAQAVDHQTPLQSLGMDSIGAAAIALSLERVTKTRIVPEVLYEHQTIDALANYLEARIGPPATVKTVEKANTDHSENELRDSQTVLAEPDVPGNSGVAAMLLEYEERVSHFNRMREQDRYFFHTTISDFDGTFVEVQGRRMLMFCSYSYLGLVGHPEVNEAVKAAVHAFGAGCHGARGIAGNTSIHEELEREIAGFLQSESALVFNTGYVTNLATVAALVRKGDWVIGDEYNHASIADGCAFSSAQAVTFKHNDMGSLEARLREAGKRNKLVVVDAVFSMEGDVAPLPEIHSLCRRYDAMLMVDEAHSLGVLGVTGRGIQEHFSLAPDAIDIKMGTLSKSLGSCGGYIAAKPLIIDYLRHSARGHVFSGATPVPQVKAALSALRILQREPERVDRLQLNTRRFVRGLRTLGFQLPPTQTPIVPILCETAETTITMTARCREEGLFLVPVIYPAVPMNAPRLRASVTAAHSDADIDLALAILARVGREVGLIK